MQEQEIEFFTKLENEKEPQLSPDERFYIIYSPMKFKLRPCESIMLIYSSKLNYQTMYRELSGPYLHKFYKN